MGKITFVLGGVRSGKSTYALSLAKKYKNVAFITTCRPFDKEMEKRIALHKKSRPAHWKTFEDPKDIPALLRKIGGKFNAVLIVCLTLWVSNFVLDEIKASLINANAKKLIAALKKIKPDSIIVSNEVGLGIVPGNKLARDFRDVAGKVNQIVAKGADEVYFMFAGLPLKLK